MQSEVAEGPLSNSKEQYKLDRRSAFCLMLRLFIFRDKGRASLVIQTCVIPYRYYPSLNGVGEETDERTLPQLRHCDLSGVVVCVCRGAV